MFTHNFDQAKYEHDTSGKFRMIEDAIESLSSINEPVSTLNSIHDLYVTMIQSSLNAIKTYDDDSILVCDKRSIDITKLRKNFIVKSLMIGKIKLYKFQNMEKRIFYTEMNPMSENFLFELGSLFSLLPINIIYFINMDSNVNLPDFLKASIRFNSVYLNNEYTDKTMEKVKEIACLI